MRRLVAMVWSQIASVLDKHKYVPCLHLLLLGKLAYYNTHLIELSDKKKTLMTFAVIHYMTLKNNNSGVPGH